MSYLDGVAASFVSNSWQARAVIEPWPEHLTADWPLLPLRTVFRLAAYLSEHIAAQRVWKRCLCWSGPRTLLLLAAGCASSRFTTCD